MCLGVGHKLGWRGWVQGGGYRGTDGSSGSGLFWAKLLKADTHNTYALVFSDSLCSDCDFKFWLKCAGSEDSVSQPGL